MRLASAGRCPATVLAVAIVLATPAGAQSGSAVVLPHVGGECSDVPKCMAVGGSPMVVGVDGVVSTAVTCPDSRPYGWHWDTEQHAHIQTRLVGRTRSTLSFSLRNLGNRAGTVSIVIGCSTEPFDIRSAGSQSSRMGARPRFAPDGKADAP